MNTPSLPWSSSLVSETADQLAARPDLSGLVLYRIAAAYGLHACQQEPSEGRTLHLVVGGADAWSSSQKEFMADPAAGLSSFLAAVESSLS